jgi:hypothetical protein
LASFFCYQKSAVISQWLYESHILHWSCIDSFAHSGICGGRGHSCVHDKERLMIREPWTRSSTWGHQLTSYPTTSSS